MYVEPDYGQTEVKNGIWIDESYIVKADKEAYIWTLNKKNRLEKTKVELGEHDENLMMYEIKSGLKKSDYIVWASDDLYEGDLIEMYFDKESGTITLKKYEEEEE